MYEIREVVGYNDTGIMKIGIVVTFSKSIFNDEFMYSVFFPEPKEYKENIKESELKRMKKI